MLGGMKRASVRGHGPALPAWLRALTAGQGRAPSAGPALFIDTLPVSLAPFMG